MNAKAQMPESGIILGMSNSDYHALPSVSSSKLKTILRSPATTTPRIWQARPARSRQQAWCLAA